MTSLFAVVSPPRSGTKWYANLFTDGEVYCYHELTTLLGRWPARAALDRTLRRETASDGYEQQQRRVFLDAYPRYFSRLLEHADLGARHVGNSDNTLVRSAPGLWLLWPETRFLFSTRNGIGQVNSASVNEPHLPPLVRAGRPASFERLTPFEAACRTWVEEIERWAAARAWLEERGARCLTTTLEGVTRELAELERVWSWVAGDWERHAARAASLMARPLNEWVNLDGAVYSPREIWESWSDERRSIFAETCGGAQASLGYDVPP